MALKNGQVQAGEEDPAGADDVAEPTLRETIESARDEVIDRQTEEAGGSDAGAGPGRDASGRFARRAPESADGGADPKPAQAAKAGKPAAPAGDAQVPGQAQGAHAGDRGGRPQEPNSAHGGEHRAGQLAPTALAPQGWTPTEKALWAGLPEAARAAIVRRENDFHRALTAQDAERATGREYSQVVQRFAPQIERDGRPPARIFSDFMQIMTVMQGNDPNAKAQLLRTVAQQNGIDARTLLGIPPQVGQQPGQQGPGGAPAPGLVPLPPAFAEMQRQWADLRARLDAQAQAEQRAAQERTQREEQEIAQEISNFQSRAEIRFFDQVKDHMIALLNGGVASNLEEAYNSAIYARPDIRAILENEARAKADAEAKRVQRTQQARIRGGSVKGGSGSNAGAAPADRSLREELQANFAAANSRA